jgi:hypothetical protein
MVGDSRDNVGLRKTQAVLGDFAQIGRAIDQHHIVIFDQLLGRTPKNIERAQKGEKIERPREPARTNVVNLMDALRKSVQAEGAKRSSATRAQPKKRKKRIEGQREMLFPIPGKKDREAAAKSTAHPSGRRRKTG